MTQAQCEEMFRSQVKQWSISLEDGAGATHQRGILSEIADLGNDEDFCLSTDAHMDFVQGWDDVMAKDWYAAENEFAILTAYPLAMKDSYLSASYFIDQCG